MKNLVCIKGLACWTRHKPPTLVKSASQPDLLAKLDSVQTLNSALSAAVCYVHIVQDTVNWDRYYLFMIHIWVTARPAICHCNIHTHSHTHTIMYQRAWSVIKFHVISKMTSDIEPCYKRNLFPSDFSLVGSAAAPMYNPPLQLWRWHSSYSGLWWGTGELYFISLDRFLCRVKCFNNQQQFREEVKSSLPGSKIVFLHAFSG